MIKEVKIQHLRGRWDLLQKQIEQLEEMQAEIDKSVDDIITEISQETGEDTETIYRRIYDIKTEESS